MKSFVIIAVIICLTCQFRLDTEPENQQLQSINIKDLEAAFQYLHSNFNNSTGTYNTTGWWNSANIQELFLDLVDYLSKHKDNTTKTDWYGLVKKQLEITYKLHYNTSFLNPYYDDEGWWALAWVKAYDVYKNVTYLQLARAIFQDMTRGWQDGVCGGGIWWNKNKTYKNAIPNELYLSLATRLYLRTNETVFYDWAVKEYNWFSNTKMINSDSLINDGLNMANPKSCTNNNGITWTYNQGVILGGLVDLANIQKNTAYITLGEKIINATLAKIIQSTSKGPVLLDKCEVDDQGKQKDGCGTDGSQFKGIFMRYLAYFCENNKNSASKYKNFATTQAGIILSQNSHTAGAFLQFGLHFAGPFDKADSSRSSSALDALLADLRITSIRQVCINQLAY